MMNPVGVRCSLTKEKNMKKVEMVIVPPKINHVKDALRKIGINKMTVSKVRKFGGQAGYTGYCRGGKYEPAFLTETRIEMEVAEEDLEKVLGAIENCTEGAMNGDEKVFVYSLDETMQLGRKARKVAAI
jgi:nitrogen regulatory protein PII